MKHHSHFLSIILIMALIFTRGFSQPNPVAAIESTTVSAEVVLKTDSLVTTTHTMTIRSGRLSYTATAGRIPIQDSAGHSGAHIFFVSYVKLPADSASRRPVAFAFNGGPGASSMWLHVGGIGPRRVALPDSGTGLSLQYTLEDNPYTWLQVMDLVFIDPVGTGYSRAAPGVEQSRYFDVRNDIESVADFIIGYTTRFKRWLSPKYLVGESYGTTRAAGIAHYLQSSGGFAFNGIVFLSSVLNFQTISFDEGNDLPCILSLPSYTAAAWYHKKINDTVYGGLPSLLDTVHRWATTAYAAALCRGNALADQQRNEIITTLSSYTGLAPRVVEEHNLRISNIAFVKELLRGERRTIGLLDARVTGIDAAPANPYRYMDPSMFNVEAVYTAALNEYIRNDLHYSTPQRYIVLSEQANRSWKWGTGSAQGYLNVGPHLLGAMSANKRLKLFAACGYYDLTTPYCSQTYSCDHLSTDPEVRNRITRKYYPSGHQLYTSLPVLEALTSDIIHFVNE